MIVQTLKKRRQILTKLNSWEIWPICLIYQRYGSNSHICKDEREKTKYQDLLFKVVFCLRSSVILEGAGLSTFPKGWALLAFAAVFPSMTAKLHDFPSNLARFTFSTMRWTSFQIYPMISLLCITFNGFSIQLALENKITYKNYIE